MFEQDYIMRQIKEMIRAILKLLFNIDTSVPAQELLEEKKNGETLRLLMNMIDEGDIDGAENALYEMAEDGGWESLETALLFYYYLNEKTDGFLEEHDFSRDEVRSGLRDILNRYGVAGFSDML